MNRIKELMEKRGAKAQEARAIFNKAIAEKRELSADERTKIDALQKECEDLDATCQIEVRQLAIEAQKTPYADLSKSEKRDLDTFDLGKALRSLVFGEALDGIEKEMVDSGRSEARASGIKTAGGIILPQMLVHRSAFGPREKRILSATGGTDLQYGGGLIQTAKMGILDAFFDALALREAGALILTGLQGNFDWPSYVAPTAFAHKTENQDAGEGSPSFTDVSFSPKRLPGFIDLSDQLLMQTGNVVEQVVRQNLIAQLSAQAEYFAIHGTGLNGQPKGILATTGIGDVAMGTNGAIPTWAKLVALETKVSASNANRGTLHYLTNEKMRGQLKVTPKVASTDSRMILDDVAGGMLNGYKPLFTNSVASNLVKGSSGAKCSPIIFGQFSDLVMGYWSGIEIDLVRDVSYAKAGKRALVFNLFHDSNVVRPVSFSAIKDGLTTTID